MVRLKMIGAGFSLFLAGIAVDRLYVKNLSSLPRKADEIHMESAHAEPSPTSTQRRNLTRRPVAPPSPPSSASPVAERLSDDPGLSSLIHDSFPSSQIVDRLSQPDGSISTQETAEDGGSIYRHFDAQGELTVENWHQATGAEISRSFYRSGIIKSFGWKRPEGSSTSIAFNESGGYEARTDRLADGSAVSTSYDETGRISSTWRIDSSGKPLDEER